MLGERCTKAAERVLRKREDVLVRGGEAAFGAQSAPNGKGLLRKPLPDAFGVGGFAAPLMGSSSMMRSTFPAEAVRCAYGKHYKRSTVFLFAVKTVKVVVW